MAKSPRNLMENPTKTFKFKEYSQEMSFIGFLFIVAVYISVFYIFNRSPSALFNNTKFWFFICNTLILIIAADYGVFSSTSKEKLDLYSDTLMRTQARTSASSFVSQYPPETLKNSRSASNEEITQISLQEKKSEVPVEKLLRVVFETNPEKPTTESFLPERAPENAMKATEEVSENIEGKGYSRSKSDTVRWGVIDEIDDKLEATKEEEEEGEDDDRFSSMSDEELNRRVEEFIERFNRQMRLQRARSY